MSMTLNLSRRKNKASTNFKVRLVRHKSTHLSRRLYTMMTKQYPTTSEVSDAVWIRLAELLGGLGVAETVFSEVAGVSGPACFQSDMSTQQKAPSSVQS